MRSGYDRMTPDEILARTQLTVERRRYQRHIVELNPYEAEERKSWEFLRAKQLREGRNPIHPAFRLYPTWEAFLQAGKPWHNHSEPGERHMMWGDRARGWEDDRYRKYPHLEPVPQYRKDYGLRPTQQAPGVGYGEFPAGVLMQMMADANGGLGADWITPGSPERMVQSYMESVRNNGLKIPGNIRHA